MTGLFDVEVKAFCQSAPYLFSVRYGHFVVRIWTERFVWNNYSQTYISSRSCTYGQSEYHSERHIVIVKVVNRQHTNRVCYTPHADPNLSQRYATYNSGTQFIVYTVQAISSLKYSDQRYALVELNLVSNRTACYYCPPHDEKVVFVSTLRQLNVATSTIATQLLMISERSVVCSVGAISQRYIQVVYSSHSDRVADYLTYQQDLLSTPQVAITIEDLLTSRYCTVGGGFVHSDRSCYFLTEPYSERGIALHYTIHTDRFVTFYIGCVFYLYDFIATPSRLVVSERLVLSRGFVYLSERRCFCEMRPVWKKKTPLASSPLLNIRSSRDSRASIKIVNDRALEVYGLNGDITEQVGLTEHKIVDQSDQNTLDVNATDNKGAAINSFGENVKKNLVASYVFKVTIDFS